MASSARIMLLLGSLLASWGAGAQVYMCKDATGRTITSDRPIPDCASTVREYGKSGNRRSDTPAPLTPEEKKLLAARAEKEKSATTSATEQRRIDRAILDRFQNEIDIEMARQRSLSQVVELIQRESAVLDGAERQLRWVQSRTESARKRQDEDDAQKSVDDSKKRLQDYEKERAIINNRYDQTLKRFRELAKQMYSSVLPGEVGTR